MDNTYLDTVAGTQLAMLTALKLFLSGFRGNAQAEDALSEELERARALLISSIASDRKLECFDETAEVLMAALTGKGS